MTEPLPIDMDVALDPESDTATLVLHDVPLASLEAVLLSIAEPAWRQNIMDGVQGAVAAKEMGIPSTERTFTLPRRP